MNVLALLLTLLKPCPENPQTRCGTLTVPESRATKNSREIAIRVMVVPASGEAVADPLFALTGGGPGVASIPEAQSFLKNYAELAKTRDIVFFDQRGTGDSNALDCETGGGDAALRAFLAGELPIAKLGECREALSKRADLRAYTTADAADDMEAIRRWLGYDTINVYGSSYTTRLALVYAQRYPKHVRTLTVKAATPFAMRNPLQAARASQDALDRVFSDCAAEEACNAAYPKLHEQFDAVLARLAAEPATVGSTQLTRDLFAGSIRRLLYAAESQRALPMIIASAARGDFTPLKPILGAGDAIDRALNLGLFLSVTCAEDVARYSEADVKRETAGTFTGDVLASALKHACAGWPTAKLRNDIGKKVPGVPALILSGVLDPDAPPVWGREVARLVPGATHLELAGVAHQGRPPCVRAIETEFITKGTMKGVDTTCVGQLKREPFVVK